MSLVEHMKVAKFSEGADEEETKVKRKKKREECVPDAQSSKFRGFSN